MSQQFDPSNLRPEDRDGSVSFPASHVNQRSPWSSADGEFVVLPSTGSHEEHRKLSAQPTTFEVEALYREATEKCCDNDFAGALHSADRALKLARTVYGDAEQGKLAKHLLTVASLSITLGDLDRATALFEQGLKFKEKMSVHERCAALQILDLAVGTFCEEGKLDHAAQLLQRKIDWERSLSEALSPQQLTDIRNLGVICFDIGHYTKAKELFSEVESKASAKKHQMLKLSAGYHLAVTLAESGEEAEALKQFEKVIGEIDLNKKQSKEEKIILADSLLAAGKTCAALGDGKGRSYLDRSALIYEKVFGLESVEHISVYDGVVQLEITTGNVDRAFEALRKELALAEKHSLAEDPEIASAYVHLGRLYETVAGVCNGLVMIAERGELGTGVSALNQIAQQFRTLRINDIECTELINRVGVAVTGGEKTPAEALKVESEEMYRKAFREYERAGNITRQHRGDNHPWLSSIYEHLARISEMLGNPGESNAFRKLFYRVAAEVAADNL